MKRCCLILAVLFLCSAVPVSGEESVDALFPAYIYEGVLKKDAAGIAAGTRVRLYEAESEKYYVIGGLRGGGRVRAIPHIAPAEEMGIKELEERIERALQ